MNVEVREQPSESIFFFHQGPKDQIQVSLSTQQVHVPTESFFQAPDEMTFNDDYLWVKFCVVDIFWKCFHFHSVLKDSLEGYKTQSLELFPLMCQSFQEVVFCPLL